MERIQGINLERLKWCCDDYGIAVGDLHAHLHISEGSLDKLIEGEQGLTFGQLQSIAAFFNRGVLFFLEPGPVTETVVHSPQFRTLENQKFRLTPEIKKLIERVEAQRDIYLSLLEDLDPEDIVRYTPPVYENGDIASFCKTTRDWLGLVEGPRYGFDDYRKAVERMGILVFLSNSDPGKWQLPKDSPIFGFSLYQDDCPVIFIKKQEAKSRQTFTLMHELGHILLQRDSNIDLEGDMESDQGAEQDANAFAGQVLVPDSLLVRIDDADRPKFVDGLDNWVAPLCKMLGVSAEVVLRRLVAVGRLPVSTYREYREWRYSQDFEQGSKDSRGIRYRDREPWHMFGDTYVRTVISALGARKITLNKAANYLDHIKINDVHKLEDLHQRLLRTRF